MRTHGLTAERLRELLHYDPQSGQFTRKTRSAKGVYVGDVAGGDTGKGYVRIYVDGKKHYAHRLAWLYMTGEWPAALIDHIDGRRSNNRFSNLREADAAINSQNQRRAKSTSRSGVLGVLPSENGQGFMARLRVNRRYVHLGTFKTIEEASEAYRAAKRLHHPGCAIWSHNH